MTPKITAVRKNKRDVFIVAEDGTKFRRELGPKNYSVGDVVLLAKRLNTPKSEEQKFEIYPVTLLESKWSIESRKKGMKWEPRPDTYFRGVRFIVEIV